MSSLDDRRRHRHGATRVSADLVIAFLWCFGGLLLRVAVLAYTRSAAPMW
jgi:hypothetical protein